MNSLGNNMFGRQWLNYKNILIDTPSFEKGFFVVNKNELTSKWKGDNTLITEDQQNIEVNGRTLSFQDNVPQNKEALFSKKLVEFLTLFDPNIKSNSNMVLCNQKRRAEIFFPIYLEKEEAGMYVYPWLPNRKLPSEFSGFERFVTVGCLFGTQLKGRDQKAGSFPLIKHDIDFFDRQQIVGIKTSRNPHPYEGMLLKEFEQFILLMSYLGSKDKNDMLSIDIVHHLPDYDYLFFGLDLFLKGRITFEALDLMFRAIQRKASAHRAAIKQICEENNILIEFVSPFSGIFKNPIEDESLDSILTQLNFDKTINIDLSTLSEDDIVERRKNFAQSCLILLKNKNYISSHQEAWEKILSQHQDIESIDDIEKIFKIANAVVIAFASSGKGDYKTCSLLPLSEKQIQLTYSGYTRKSFSEAQNLSKVFNLTVLEPVVSQSDLSKGNIFYFDGNNSTLSKLLSETHIVKETYHNIALFAQNKPTRPLSDIVDLQTEHEENDKEYLKRFLGTSPKSLKK